MATVIVRESPQTINAANTYVLGRQGPGAVGRWLVHLTSASFSGSITVKGRIGANAFVAIPYRQYHLNGAVSDGAYASTAITGTSAIDVDWSDEVAIDCTSYTSGSMAMEFRPYTG